MGLSYAQIDSQGIHEPSVHVDFIWTDTRHLRIVFYPQGPDISILEIQIQVKGRETHINNGLGYVHFIIVYGSKCINTVDDGRENFVHREEHKDFKERQ